MKQTYDEAMARVYEDEGGYSNDAGDPGGPTKYGITIHDARQYWKSNATAADVRAMPKSVAADIYSKHYANPIRYNDLPPGVDYAVLDYGINSGISRGAKVLQRIVGVPVDGQIGQSTIDATNKMDIETVINKIYDERLRFLQGLSTWSIFGKGWGSRVRRGRQLALSLEATYGKQWKAPTIGAEHNGPAIIVAGGAGAAATYPHLAIYIAIGTVVIAIGSYFLIKYLKGKPNGPTPSSPPSPIPLNTGK